MHATHQFIPYWHNGLLLVEPTHTSWGRKTYVAQLTAEQELMNDSELIKLADSGNGCFGGSVTREDIDGIVIEATIAVYTD